MAVADSARAAVAVTAETPVREAAEKEVEAARVAALAAVGARLLCC